MSPQAFSRTNSDGEISSRFFRVGGSEGGGGSSETRDGKTVPGGDNLVIESRTRSAGIAVGKKLLPARLEEIRRS